MKFLNLLGFVVCALLVLRSEAIAEANEAPNIIIILADDLGIGDVSAYNESSAWETPHIDRLAASGMRFTDAHSNAALCTPTRYGIMTGRYAWRTRLKSSGFNGYSRPLIADERLTMPEMLSENGYETALIGKWHLGWNWHYLEDRELAIEEGRFPKIDFSKPVSSGPKENGFNYSFGLMASLSSPPFVYVENGMPTSIPEATSVNYDEKAFWRKGPIGTDFKHVDVLPELTRRAVSYIEEKASENQPFFLYFAMTAPHAPIIPPSEYIGKSNTNAYGDFVLMVDDMVGQVLQAVESDPRLRKTLIVFTSDNGQLPRADFDDDELPLAGQKGSYIYRGKKFDIYEGGHRVPFIVSWPGEVEAGSLSSETISTVDFMATFAELRSVTLSDQEAEDSLSFLPVLRGGKMDTEKRVATVVHSSDGRFAIRKGDWKLVLWPGSGGWAYPKTADEMAGLPRFQLYNLAKDPGETLNLYSKHPERVTELKALLEEYVDAGRSTRGAKQRNDGDARWEQLEWMSR
ncbi:sulfatase family protein [Pelagicoccus mobilis]|uniref:Arylsulfatase n=1 Tax=Pelagicoccus mobilis TaxID=415221 RepID=A0A934S4P1_9BACT|nr:arylsulfatase [Pelagicoccus mobilis]MBK1878943.1 arylsulfatase [Pelagicoccus mobilis]